MKWVNNVARPRPRNDGSIIFDGVMFDITRRKIDERNLLKAKNEADKANKAKSDFLANMSHELRTPLNAIIGMSEVMKTEALGPLTSDVYREYSGDINESGIHLLQIINDILDIAAIENNALVPEFSAVRPREVAESCLRLIRTRADDKNISLSMAASDPLPVLNSDERMMKQIILNLLSNAVKFTPEGGRVTLSIEADPRSGIVMSVEDDGIGIKEADIDAVMQPFGQVEGSQSRKYEGTGLGLPLVKAMVNVLGGTFALRSKFGVGTVAKVTWPCACEFREVADIGRVG